MAMPMLPGLPERLIAVRDRMLGGQTFVWLCLDENDWWTTEDHGARKGRWFARVTIGKGDSDGAVRNAAWDLIEKIETTIRSERTAAHSHNCLCESCFGASPRERMRRREWEK